MNDFQSMIAALIKAGMTQQAIADEVGIHQSTVSKIAVGARAEMRYSNAMKLKALFESRCTTKRRQRVAA